MPMPELDPSRFKRAVLADPKHKLPLPDKGGRLFLADGEIVDLWDAHTAHLLADGSLRLEEVARAAATPAAPPAADADAATPAT